MEQSERERRRSQNVQERELPTFIQLSVGFIPASLFLCHARAPKTFATFNAYHMRADKQNSSSTKGTSNKEAKKKKINQNNNMKIQFHNFRENCDTVCCAAHSR